MASGYAHGGKHEANGCGIVLGERRSMELVDDQRMNRMSQTDCATRASNS